MIHYNLPTTTPNPPQEGDGKRRSLKKSRRSSYQRTTFRQVLPFLSKIIVRRKEVGHKDVLRVTRNTWRIYIGNQ